MEITSTERKQKLSREQRNRWMAFLLLLPAAAFLIGLIAYPLGKVILDSFQHVNLINNSVSGFAGLANFQKVITNEFFGTAVKNTVIWTTLSVAGEYVLGLITAIALSQSIKGRGIFRSLIIIPFIVPIVVAGSTWEWMLSPDFGIINYLLTQAGIISAPINWLGTRDTALLTVVFVNIWRTFPYYTISLLAALQAIPHDIIEASAVDGANIRQRFFKIIMPQLKSVSWVLIIVHLIWTAVNFDFIWIMTAGGPFYASETLPIQIYRYAMQQLDVGVASALSTMMISMMVTGFIVYYYCQRIRKNREG